MSVLSLQSIANFCAVMDTLVFCFVFDGEEKMDTLVDQDAISEDPLIS